MTYVEHPLIRKDTIESRVYQEKILATAVTKNTLVVLPTGLGKTALAAMVVAHTMQKYPEKRVLFLAPTRPLVTQHRNSFVKFFNIDDDEIAAITGFLNPEDREFMYRKKIIFATPQVVKNDVANGFIDFEKFSLLVFDEVHRTRGAYAYSAIAKIFEESSPGGRVLALTASPGSSREKIDKMCSDIGIEAVEIRMDTDEDVLPYVKERDVEWVFADLPKEFEEIIKLLRGYIDKKAEKIGPMVQGNITKGRLIELQRKMQAKIRQGDKSAFFAVSTIAELLKVEYALEMAESQGISALVNYLKKMKSDADENKSRAVKRIMSDEDIKKCFVDAEELFSRGVEHPKLTKLVEIVRGVFAENSEAKIIIFSNYRNTVNEIVKKLGAVDGCRPVSFVGQSRNEINDGITQTEQTNRLQLFRDGYHNCLVGTSISEEGLDIPAVDVAVFYEPIASEIRSIQRRGRVGRSVKGKVFVLIAKKTRDEAYYWSAQHKERNMKRILTSMQFTPKSRGLQRWAR